MFHGVDQSFPVLVPYEFKKTIPVIVIIAIILLLLSELALAFLTSCYLLDYTALNKFSYLYNFSGMYFFVYTSHSIFTTTI